MHKIDTMLLERVEYRIGGNEISEWSLFAALACTLYGFIPQFLNTVQTYLHSMYYLAVTFTLTPMTQKAEKQPFSKRLVAASIEWNVYKIQFKLSRFRLHAFFKVLEHFA